MNSQPYAMIYYDSACQTFNEALRKANAIPNPIFCYRHTVQVDNIHSDLSYASYIKHDVVNEIITLTFPPECKWISSISNNHNCKMVMYYKNIQTYLNNGTYLSEVTIEPSMNVDTRAHQDVSIRIYTRGLKNLEIYVTMNIIKPVKCKL